MNRAIDTFRISRVTMLCCAAALGAATGAWAQQSPSSGAPASAPASSAGTPGVSGGPQVSGDSGTGTRTKSAATPAKATAQSEAGEPRADTSAPPVNGTEAGANTADTQTHSSGAAANASGSAAKASDARAGTPRASAPGRSTASGPGQKPGAADRLNLGTATVTGDREQPKVMYIVPWKKSDIGDLGGKPMNSLVDEILTPVDRDVFKREVVYYQAVQADASQNGASPRPAPQGEK